MLQHTSCVIKPGRTFLRHSIALLSVVKPHGWISLNLGLRSDLVWWVAFLPAWNDSMMLHAAKGSQGPVPKIGRINTASGQVGAM